MKLKINEENGGIGSVDNRQRSTQHLTQKDCLLRGKRFRLDAALIILSGNTFRVVVVLTSLTSPNIQNWLIST